MLEGIVYIDIKPLPIYCSEPFGKFVPAEILEKINIYTNGKTYLSWRTLWNGRLELKINSQFKTRVH